MSESDKSKLESTANTEKTRESEAATEDNTKSSAETKVNSDTANETKVDIEITAESDTKATTENNTETENETETATKNETETSSETETATKYDTETGNETETAIKNDTEAGNETETAIKNETEAGNETETAIKNDTEAGNETETAIKNETETATGSSTEGTTESDTETGSETETVTEMDTENTSEVATETETEGSTETETEAEIETEEEITEEETTVVEEERIEEWNDTMATSTATDARGINLNVDGKIAGVINPGQPTTREQSWGNGEGSYIYYGNYYQSNSNDPNEPVRYRVLDNANSSKEGGNADSILLWSDKIMDVIPYWESKQSINGEDIWTDSLVRKWLNAEKYEDYKDVLEDPNKSNYTRDGYLGTAFSPAERGFIQETRKEKEIDGYGHSAFEYSSSLEDDKIYLLSLGEIETEKYGFYQYTPGNNDNVNSRHLNVTSYTYDKVNKVVEKYWRRNSWWLRTSVSVKPSGYEGAVVYTRYYDYQHDDGIINEGGVLSSTYIGVAPAFNLNRSQILLAMEAVDNASINKTTLGLSKVQGTSASQWQLTMLDTSQQFQIGTAQRDGTTITVPYTYRYTGSNDTDANQISIMITDKPRTENGVQVLYYGKGKTDGEIDSSSEVTFDLPSNFDYEGSNWHTYIFSEQVNGFRQTDFASEPVEIPSSELNLKPINTIAITGVDVPAGGLLLDEFADCAAEGIIETTAPIIWNPADITAGFAVEYTAEIPLTAKEGYKFIAEAAATVNGNPAELSYNEATKALTVSYTFPKTEKAKLISIPPIEDIEMPNGTPLESFKLKLENLKYIPIETEDENTNQAQVTWDLDKITTSTYDPSKKTEQIFTINGTITLPENIINTDSISRIVKVTVIVSAAEAVALTIDVPVGGRELAESAYCRTEGIEERNPRIQWSPAEQTAGFNKVYTAKITLTALPSFTYTEGTKATVNGRSADTEFDNSTRIMTVRYEFPATDKAKLVRIPKPDNIENVANGSDKTAAGLGLPEKIAIVTEDKETNTAAVRWDLDNLAEGSYDPSIKTEQTFRVNGVVTLPENIQNPDNISLKIQIQVMVSAEGAFFIELDRAQQLNPTSPEAVGYATVTLKKTSMVYTGAQLRPAVTVKYTYLEYNDSGMKSKKKQKTLKENVDYTITYKNNIDVHNGSGSNAPSIVLNGIGDFSGAIRKNFIITPKDIKNVTIEPIGDMIYTGMDLSGQVKEAIVVRDGNSILNPERDYTVSFFTGKKGTVPVYNVTGTYMQDTQMRVVITAKTTGNYKGTAKKKATFYIRGSVENRTNLSYDYGLQGSFKKNLSEKPLIYNGKPQKPALDIKLNGKKLSSKNYSLIYENNINAGVNTATVTILGKNACYGKRSLSFSIQPKDFSKVSVKGLSKIYFRKSISDLKPFVKDGNKVLVQGQDFKMDVEEIGNIQFLGSKLPVLQITLTPTLENTNYIPNTVKRIKVTVTKRKLTDRFNTKIVVENAILTPEAMVNGAQPLVTVNYNSETLKEGIDYTLSYKKNKKIGTAQVVITGIGAYSGKRTIKFQIISP